MSEQIPDFDVNKLLNSITNVELKNHLKMSIIQQCMTDYIKHISICGMFENDCTAMQIYQALQCGAMYEPHIFKLFVDKKSDSVELLQYLRPFMTGEERISNNFRLMQVKYFHKPKLFPHVYFSQFINEIYQKSANKKTTLFLEIFHNGEATNDILKFLLKEGANPLLVLPPPEYYKNRVQEYLKWCIVYAEHEMEKINKSIQYDGQYFIVIDGVPKYINVAEYRYRCLQMNAYFMCLLPTAIDAIVSGNTLPSATDYFHPQFLMEKFTLSSSRRKSNI
jgi:hypothetical protein